jgi:hypothetical protein
VIGEIGSLPVVMPLMGLATWPPLLLGHYQQQKLPAGSPGNTQTEILDRNGNLGIFRTRERLVLWMFPQISCLIETHRMITI